MTCCECRYWDQLTGEKGKGLCRINPPMGASEVLRWPTVGGLDWCGKLAPRVLYPEEWEKEGEKA